MAPSREPQFWIEELVPSRPRPGPPSGCELCEHCALLALLATGAARAPERAAKRTAQGDGR
jgi:hypothetical protein